MTDRTPHEDRAASRPDRAAANPHRHVIAIDGPAAAGKTTVARALADRVGATLFDTGSLYRTLTLVALREGIPTDDGPALAATASTARRDIQVRPPSVPDGRLYDVLLDGEDVTWAIRTAEVDAHVSAVSAHSEVRAALLPVQRAIAAEGPVVMVGRDVTTVVIPEAGVKIYLDASPEERARRRHRELRDRGIDADYASILADVRQRDAFDSGRTVAPLRIAANATVLDTDGLSVDEVVDRAEAIARAAWQGGPMAGDEQRRRE